MIKQLAKKILPKPLVDWISVYTKDRYQKSILDDWIAKGRPIPTVHIAKQLAIKEYQKKYGIATMVETGTYHGDMVEAQRKTFSRLYSIELAPKLYEEAVIRFKSFPHITIKQGDSGLVMPEIAKELKGAALFWLDGHYSGAETAKGELECPIYNEVDAIFSTPYEHILLIDDARLFIGEKDYPTLEEFEKYIKDKRPSYKMVVKDDIIRVFPG